MLLGKPYLLDMLLAALPTKHPQMGAPVLRGSAVDPADPGRSTVRSGFAGCNGRRDHLVATPLWTLGNTCGDTRPKRRQHALSSLSWAQIMGRRPR